jgi:predicted porin
VRREARNRAECLSHCIRSTLTVGLLAFIGACPAQTTVFGTLDLYADWTKAPGKHLARVDASGLNSNRLGVKAVEPLSERTTITAYLEMGFNPDTGDLTGSGFDKLNYLSVLGPDGRFAIGKQYTPQFIAMGRIDAFGSSFWGTPYAVFAGGNRYITASRALQYQTPRLFDNTLQVSAFYSFAAANEDPSRTQLFLSAQLWPNEAVYLALVVGRDQRYLLSSPKRNLVLLGAGYDFGTVRVSGGFQTLNDPDSRNVVHEWTFGASALAGSVDRLMINYARSADQASVTKVAATYGVAWTHALSPTTSLYASVARITNGANSARSFGMSIAKGESSSNVMAGMRKNF